MKTRVIILGAGKGKRMKSELPKVLTPLLGRPLISYVAEAVIRSGVDPEPIIVVGYKADLVKDVLGPEYIYAHQSEQLGTGHAVMCAKDAIADVDRVIVVYGDMPFITPETILRLKEASTQDNAVLAMAFTRVDDFNDWRSSLFDFGRILRDDKGVIRGIVELKDATDAERAIMELNPSFFCFEKDWLLANLENLKNNNAQQEYYLTDLVRIAIDGGDTITSIEINPLETIGINSPEQLELASQLMTVR